MNSKNGACLTRLTVALLAISPFVQATLYCRRWQSCWPSDADVQALYDAFEPNATRLLIQEPSGPKVAPLAQPQASLQEAENSQPLFGLGSSQMEPLYRRTDYEQTCWDIDYSSDFCKATLMNHYIDADPDFVVLPLTPEHVQTALAFALEHDLRIVVAGAGHDFVGRNQNPTDGGSILIRTILMRSKSIDLEDTEGLGYESATFGAGMIFSEAQEFLVQHERMMPTGSCDSVGVVGWSIGGGHGMWAPKLGLGSDNLLAVDIVLASGDHVRATDNNEYADLLKALRGGGGSSWGIITSITVRVHEYPADGVALFVAVLGSGAVADGGLDEMEAAAAAFVPQLLNASADVSLWINNRIQDGNWIMRVLAFSFGGPTSAAGQEVVAAITNSGVPAAGVITIPFPDPYAFSQFQLVDSTLYPRWGSLGGVSNVIVKHDDVDKLPGVLRELAAIDCPGFGFCTRTFVNGLTGNIGSPQPTGANSLSAGLRTGLGMIFTNAIEDQRPMIDAFGGNVYMNEAAPTLDNVLEYVPRFWGEHWPQLLVTKAKYDPDYIFRCRQCVPSL